MRQERDARLERWASDLGRASTLVRAIELLVIQLTTLVLRCAKLAIALAVLVYAVARLLNVL